jgi:hypothetical protein
MATQIQVVIDTHDSLAQARFWATALGYEVEDNTALIERVTAAGLATEADWFEDGGRLYWNGLVAARDPDGSGPRILFQRVPESKQVKNRVHLDLNVGPDRRADEVARLVAAGATELYEIDEPGGHHVTLADPEGNEFCVQ